MCWVCALPTQAQLGNDFAIALDVASLDVVEKTTTPPDHHQKSTTTVMVVRVGLEMLGEMVDAIGQQGNLHFGGASVGSVRTMLGDRFVLGCCSHGGLAFRVVETEVAESASDLHHTGALSPSGHRHPTGVGGETRPDRRLCGIPDLEQPGSGRGPNRYPEPMFTGIVEELGTVISSRPAQSDWGPGVRLRIQASTVLEASDLGASIAVNGCCLTLVDSGGSGPESWWETDVSSETLERTTIGSLRPGDRVNLERPMALGERLGGHIVLGHVDAVGEVVSSAPDLVVRVPRNLMRYLVEKGSVTVDGISLTAFDITDDTFRVAVIPHTADVTTLGHRPTGSHVNLEMDVLAKHIERLVEPYRATP